MSDTPETTPAPIKKRKPKKKHGGGKKKGDKRGAPALGEVRNPKGHEANFGNRMVQYRRRLYPAVERVLTTKELEQNFRVLMEIRDDKLLDPTHRISAIKELNDRMLGKSSVQAEINLSSSSTYEVRLQAAMVAAGLVRREDPPEIVDGSITSPSSDREDRVAIPSLPAPVDTGHFPICGSAESSTHGRDVLSLVQVIEEAGSETPGPTEDD